MLPNRGWFLRVALVCVAAAFGVFVLPFLLPPAPMPIVSASNAAGFNNKIAAVVTAGLGVLVLLSLLRWPLAAGPAEPAAGTRSFAPISRKVLGLTVLALTIWFAVLDWVVASTQNDFSDDAYFLNQTSKHLEAGRQLYTQIEFPYGPLLFYAPQAMHALLSPFHASVAFSYYTLLAIEQIAGWLLLAYIINGLPILPWLKNTGFVLFAIGSLVFSCGLNYTLFRFTMSLAFLTLASKQRRPLPFAGVLLLGEFFSLCLSAEMGFAFAAASVAWGVYTVYRNGRAWLVAPLAPLVAIPVFLLSVGEGYLRMLQMFAGGVYNLIVEPLPYTLFFLAAAIWVVPGVLARGFRNKSPETPLMAAMYVFALALLPVAFGRADPAHVLLNGLAIYPLSLVAASGSSRPFRVAWVACLAFVMLWTLKVNTLVLAGLPTRLLYDVAMRQSEADRVKWLGTLRSHHLGGLERRYLFAVDQARADFYNPPFDLAALRRIVGNAPVATPFGFSENAGAALKSSGQYVPSFYDFQTAVLDRKAEERELNEFNQSEWAMLPTGKHILQDEPAENTGRILGASLPYHSKRAPYVAGVLFEENLRTHWEPVGQVGEYTVYHQVGR